MVFGLLLATGMSLTASVLVFQVAVLPLLFKYSKTVQRKVVFSNFINYPRNLNYERPSSSNIIGGKNFSIDFHSKEDNCPVKIGVWHLLPYSSFRRVFLLGDEKPPALDTIWQELHATADTIVLYCHGNSNHRASPQRLQLYKVFQELNFHVIAFDYRGYGDSTMVRPTERGVVEDLLQVYSWLHTTLNQEKRPMVILWGHSLGTAIASNMVANLPQLCEKYSLPSLPPPDVLVLEGAFNNLTEEIAGHPCSKCVSWLPYYTETFVKPFSVSSEYSFTTDQYLPKVPDVPVLMLHAVEDKVVPYQLACKLHSAVAQSRELGGAPLVFHTFDRGCGLGHNNICLATDLKNIIKQFLMKIKKEEEKNQELENNPVVEYVMPDIKTKVAQKKLKICFKKMTCKKMIMT